MRRAVENLKTILLVVLFAATILLLYLTWTQSDTGRRLRISDILPSTEAAQDAPKIEDALVPQVVACGHGDGAFVRPQDWETLYLRAMEELREACSASSIPVTEITEESYRRVLEDYESLLLSFDYGIPFTEFCTYNGVKRISGAEGIGNFTSLAFSSLAPESFFLESDSGRFYRAISDAEFSVMQQAQASPSEDGASYVFAQSVFGSGSTALLPLEYASILQIQFLEAEASSRGKEPADRRFAEEVFGETFDFVRRITDDFGNITYMYGYGQKSLTRSADGIFEYRAAAREGNAGGFFDDLQAAIDFVAAAGGWDALNGQSIDFELCFAEDAAHGHRFFFKQSQCAGTAIEIEVTAGQISYYKRDVVLASGGVQLSPREATSAVNVIASNCNHIYNVQHDLTLTVDSDESLEYVAANLRSMKADHYRSPLENALLPAWVVTMKDGMQFYFDLYRGTPLGYAK